MKLITKDILKNLPLLKDLEESVDFTTKVPLKLFSPVGSATWFIMAIDGESKELNEETILYGLCFLDVPEFGRVSLQELKEVVLPLGLGIERDRGWSIDKTLRDANDYLKDCGYGNIDWLERR
jgi:hypothetical protein